MQGGFVVSFALASKRKDVAWFAFAKQLESLSDFSTGLRLGWWRFCVLRLHIHLQCFVLFLRVLHSLLNVLFLQGANAMLESVCSLTLPRLITALQPVTIPPSVYLGHPALSPLFLPPSPSPLPRFLSDCSLWVTMETEGLSSFRQRCGARGDQGGTLNTSLSPPLPPSLSDDCLHNGHKQTLL